MITNIFKTQTPVALFALPVFALIFALSIFFLPNSNYETSYVWMTEMFNWCNQNKIVLFLITAAAGTGNALLLNFSFNQSDFFGKNTYLPGIVYLFSLFAFDEFVFSSNLIAHFFVIVGLYKLLNLRRQEESKALIFKASLSFGMAIFFKPLLLPLLLLPWFGLAVFRPFVWREYFVVFAGILVPSLMHIALHFVATGNWFVVPEDLILQIVPREKNLFHYLSYTFCASIFLYAIWKYFVVSSTEVVRFKKLSRLIFHTTWLTSLHFGLEFYLYQHISLALFIPLGMVASVSILHTKSTLLLNLLFICWFISSGLKLFL